MTVEAALPGADVACPYLGLIDDRATRFTYPSAGHRCYATARPSTIDIPKQGRDCLTAEHVTCPRYHPQVLAAPTEHVRIDSDLAVSRSPGRRAGRRLARIALILLALIGTVLVGLLIGAGLAAQLVSRDGTTPAPSALAGDASPPTAVVSATPTMPSPSPTPSAAASASPEPSATPDPSPSGPVIHVVEVGQNLTMIAQRYGVTVAALKKANSITDPNLIFVGQKLVIPLP